MIWQNLSAAMLFIGACFSFLVLKMVKEANYLNMAIIAGVYLMVVLIPLITQLFSLKKYNGRHDSSRSQFKNAR